LLYLILLQQPLSLKVDFEILLVLQTRPYHLLELWFRPI